MKRTYLGVIVGFGLAALGWSNSASAQVGEYGYSIELTGTGLLASHSGQRTLYAVQPDPNNAGAGNLPTGSSATLDTTDWTASSNLATPLYSLGVFNPLVGDTLTLQGGSILTFTYGAAAPVDTASLNYGISLLGTGPAGYNAVPLSADVATGFDGAAGNSRFATESQSINVLSGLSAGTYELATFGDAIVTGTGITYANNAGANYVATFTVLTPEPASIAVLSLSGLALCHRRRRA